MTHLRQQMIEDMQLRSLSKSTQVAYVRSVRQFAEHCGKSPDQISEQELRQLCWPKMHIRPKTRCSG